MAQETVTSPDGTSIACWRSGGGPPLVLVHGAVSDHSRWAPVVPAFERHFTVCAVDRRGRGASGDAEDFAIEREFADAAAVVDSLGGPVVLLGHSYGGLCALEAALLSRNVRALVLYDPAVEAGMELHPPDVVEQLEALLRATRFRGLAVPTLLLRGSESPSAYRVTQEALDDALPDSRVVVLPGQGHGAMDTAPDLFTAEVLRFTGSTR